MNIFLIGAMAAGKSRVGRTLARRLQRPFCDTDELLQQRAAMDIPTLFAQQGEAGFRKHETAALRTLSAKRNLVVATGGGVVLAAQNRKHLKENGIVIYLATPLKKRYQRMQTPSGRPLLMAGDAYQIMCDLDRVRTPLYQALADFTVDNSGTVDATTAKISDYLSSTI